MCSKRCSTSRDWRPLQPERPPRRRPARNPSCRRWLRGLPRHAHEQQYGRFCLLESATVRRQRDRIELGLVVPGATRCEVIAHVVVGLEAAGNVRKTVGGPVPERSRCDACRAVGGAGKSAVVPDLDRGHLAATERELRAHSVPESARSGASTAGRAARVQSSQRLRARSDLHARSRVIARPVCPNVGDPIVETVVGTSSHGQPSAEVRDDPALERPARPECTLNGPSRLSQPHRTQRVVRRGRTGALGVWRLPWSWLARDGVAGPYQSLDRTALAAHDL